MKKRTDDPGRQQVVTYLRSLQRPAYIPQRRWRGIMQLLWRLVWYYPNIYPSEMKLAMDLHVCERTIKSWVAWAKEAELLEVTPNAGVKRAGNPAKTNRYHITELPVARAVNAPALGAVNAHKPTGDTYVSPVCTQEPSVPSPSVKKPTVRAGRSAARTSVGSVTTGREKKTSSELIADANGTGYKPKRQRSPDRDPGRRCANYFADQWLALVEEFPEFNSTRPWESKPATTGYVNTVFLRPESGRRYTEVEVQAYIDGFIEGVRTGYTVIKNGQSAWMRFTGWWGREVGTAEAIFNDSADKYLR